MKIDIDIACVATLRPDLLETTLDTHIECLFKKRVRDISLIVNIDCTGLEEPGNKSEEDDKLRRVIDIIKTKGFAHVQYTIVKRPHFGKAFCRVMNATRAGFVFYLEEDWRMDINLDFDKMITLMLNNPLLAHLRLSAFKSDKYHLKQWNKFLLWNGKFFEVKEEERGIVGWAGHPSINRGSFMRNVLRHIKPEENPEKQIKARRYYHPMNNITRYAFGSYHPQNTAPAIVDIGRSWMIDKGYKKQGNKAFFTEWEKELV